MKILKQTSEIEYLRLKVKFGATLNLLKKEIWECRKEIEEEAVEGRRYADEDRGLIQELPKFRRSCYSITYYF